MRSFGKQLPPVSEADMLAHEGFGSALLLGIPRVEAPRTQRGLLIPRAKSSKLNASVIFRGIQSRVPLRLDRRSHQEGLDQGTKGKDLGNIRFRIDTDNPMY